MHPEEALFETFIVPSKRQRYLDFLETKRGRDKILAALDHFKDLDPRFCAKVRPVEQNANDILRILRSCGAPTVRHLISSEHRWDGRKMPLSDALGEIIGGGSGTFVSCIPGELAYFEGEGQNERYICRREGRR